MTMPVSVKRPNLPAYATELGYSVKVCVMRDHGQVVLPCECGDPEIIFWNWHPCLAEFLAHIGVMPGGFAVHVEHHHGGFYFCQPCLTRLSVAGHLDAEAILANYNRW